MLPLHYIKSAALFVIGFAIGYGGMELLAYIIT
jgi:hypothetical protein